MPQNRGKKQQQQKEVISRAGLASAIESGTCFVTQPGMGGSFDTQPSKLEIMTQLLRSSRTGGSLLRVTEKQIRLSLLNNPILQASSTLVTVFIDIFVNSISR